MLEPGGATAFRSDFNDDMLIHPAREQARPVPGTASGTYSSRDGQLRAASRGGQAFGTCGWLPFEVKELLDGTRPGLLTELRKSVSSSTVVAVTVVEVVPEIVSHCSH